MQRLRILITFAWDFNSSVAGLFVITAYIFNLTSISLACHRLFYPASSSFHRWTFSFKSGSFMENSVSVIENWILRAEFNYCSTRSRLLRADSFGKGPKLSSTIYEFNNRPAGFSCIEIATILRRAMKNHLEDRSAAIGYVVKTYPYNTSAYMWCPYDHTRLVT